MNNSTRWWSNVNKPGGACITWILTLLSVTMESPEILHPMGEQFQFTFSSARWWIGWQLALAKDKLKCNVLLKISAWEHHVWAVPSWVTESGGRMDSFSPAHSYSFRPVADLMSEGQMEGTWNVNEYVPSRLVSSHLISPRLVSDPV